MQLGNELLGADTFLVSQMAANSDLVAAVSNQFCPDWVPQGTQRPYVVFSFVAGRDTSTVGSAFRIFTRPLYRIEAVAEGDGYEQAASLANWIDQALHGQKKHITMTINGQSVNLWVGCVRERPYRLVENEDGIRVNHVGGFYRLFVSYEQ